MPTSPTTRTSHERAARRRRRGAARRAHRADLARRWPRTSCPRSSRGCVPAASVSSRCAGGLARPAAPRRCASPRRSARPASRRPRRWASQCRTTGSGHRRARRAVGYFAPGPALARRAAPSQAGDPLGDVDVLGIRQEVTAPVERHRQRASSSRPARRWSTARPLVEIEALPEPLEATAERRPMRSRTSRRTGSDLMFGRILIANRGEIALRVLRACRSMGIEAVVAHSEADRQSRAVLMADETICIGPAEVGALATCRRRPSSPRPW